MYRIVGLLNDEEKYQDTPHNIGGQILNELVEKKDCVFFENISSGYFNKKRRSKIFEGEIFNEDFEIIIPKLFMNNSGDVFSSVFLKENKEELKKVVVIYDDIALPFGEIKISFDRGDGGHNGIKDIIKKIDTKKFIRVRLGVCPLDFFGRPRKPKGQSSVNYLVNKKISKKNFIKVEEMKKKIPLVLESILKFGYQKTMNDFN